MEFSYYLVLKYSLKTRDFNPLLMFSVNNGLYPIAKSIFMIMIKIFMMSYLKKVLISIKEGIYELKNNLNLEKR